MSQLLAGGGPYTLTKTWFVNGTQADVGTVTVGIVDGNGTEVVADGTTTTKTGSGTSTVYSYSLASKATPSILRVTWTRTDTASVLVDRYEVVGGLLFTESQARTFAAKADATTTLIPLASATEYPDAVIAAEHTRICDDLEAWTGRSWIPRYARLVSHGSTSAYLNLDGICCTSDGFVLSRPGRYNDIAQILSVAVNGSTVNPEDVTPDPSTNKLYSASGWRTTAPFGVTVEYVYGLPAITDGVDRIALKLLVDRLVPSAWPDRVLSADTEYGTTRFVQPGGPQNNVSQLPEVNDWVHRRDMRVLIG